MEIPHFKNSCISHRAALNDLNNDIRIPTIVQAGAQTARSLGGVAGLATPPSISAIERKIQMAKAKTNRAGRAGHLML